MFSFRHKILISYILLFILFTSATFPLARRIVRSIIEKAMEDRADELIGKIQSAANNNALVRRLKEQKSVTFFRVSVISDEGKILYDSHTKQLLGPRFSQEYIIDQPEVIEAFSKGRGYHEDFSELLQQKFSYFAKTFEFHGKLYVIRTAFPYKYFSELIEKFEIAFLILTTSILLLFSFMTWFIINRLTSPIQQIIQAVAPYEEGKQISIPEIRLSSSDAKGSFDKLALTLNSMSNKIQKHINSLTEERNEKESILEALIEGVMAVDNEMKVTYLNMTAKKFLNPDLVGQNFSEAFFPESFALLDACQKEKKILSANLNLVKEEGKIYLDILAIPKVDQTGAVLVMQDKSPHYKLLEMRKDFIANASHELKTPITIIHGFAEILNENPDLSSIVIKEMTQKIVINCERMATLIKDLLTLSDIDRIPLSRLETINLNLLIQQCVNTLHDIFPEANIAIKTVGNEEIFAIVNQSLIELAIMNLLENAAKYSIPPANIHISLEKEKGKIKIKISDHGIGIPKEDIKHIFERFYRVNQVDTQKKGGSGLGLSIVQDVIHKHFGQIFLESEVGIGTTFTLILPEYSNSILE